MVVGCLPHGLKGGGLLRRSDVHNGAKAACPPKRYARRREGGYHWTVRVRATAAWLTLTLILMPGSAVAQDKWFAADKAKHFGAGAGIAAGGYIIAMPLTKKTRWRVVLGTSTGSARPPARNCGTGIAERRRGAISLGLQQAPQPACSSPGPSIRPPIERRIVPCARLTAPS